MNYKVVSDYNLINKQKWLKFVNNHSKGNVFQLPFMYEIYKGTEDYKPFVFALYDVNDEIIGILVGTSISYFGISSVFTSRNIISGGPIVRNNDQKLITYLLDHYNARESSKILFTEIKNFNEQLNENDAYQASSYKFESHLNFLIDLSVSKDKIWSRINRSRKKSIKKAEKLGVYFSEIDIKDTQKLSKAYLIIQDVYHRAKLPLPKIDIFKNAVNNSDKNSQLKIFSVIFEEEIIGVRFTLIYRDYIYGWYAGSYSKFYKYSPNELLAWKTLEWGHDNGYKTFDYGGAGKPNIPYGVRDFKSKFGGILVNFGRYEFVHKPLIMSVAKIVFSLKQKLT